MTRKDWRGHEYDTGSVIVYCTSQGSSSAKMTEGKITSIQRVYYNEDYKWEAIPEGEEPPFKKRYGWFDKDTGILHPTCPSPEDRPGYEFREYMTGERVDTETRIKVLVLRTSDGYFHHRDTKVGKEVTLTRTDHITVVPRSVTF